MSYNPVDWISSARSYLKILALTYFSNISKYCRITDVNWDPIEAFYLAYPKACFYMFNMLIYSLNIYCKGRGRLVGGVNFLVVNYEKLVFYFMACYMASERDFLSLSLSWEIFCIISFCYLVRTFCNFYNRLSRNLINRISLLTSLGTSIIF